MVSIIMQAADRLGLCCRLIDPEFGYLFELGDGHRSITFVGGQSPLNDAVAWRIAQDKFYTAMVLRDAGFAVPESVRCIRPGYFRHADCGANAGWEPGLQFARSQGFPVVVKPNRMALGRDVAVVFKEAELVEAVERAWEGDYMALVQSVVPGVDLRVDLLDGHVMAAYTRRPVVLEGDGHATIAELLARASDRYGDERYRARLMGDAQWVRLVLERGWDLDTVLPAGTRLDFGGTVLNLNRWAVADMVDELAPSWLELCRRIANVMRLRHLGIDLKVPASVDVRRLDRTPVAEATVIEVNASPSVAQMYESGRAEEAVQAEMLVLRAVFENCAPIGPRPI